MWHKYQKSTSKPMDPPTNKELAQIMLLFDRRINGLEKNMDQIKGMIARLDEKINMKDAVGDLEIDADTFLMQKQMEASKKFVGSKFKYSKEELLKLKHCDIKNVKVSSGQNPRTRAAHVEPTSGAPSPIAHPTPRKWPIVSSEVAEKILSEEDFVNRASPLSPPTVFSSQVPAPFLDIHADEKFEPVNVHATLPGTENETYGFMQPSTFSNLSNHAPISSTSSNASICSSSSTSTYASTSSVPFSFPNLINSHGL